MNGHKASRYSQVSELAPEFRLDSVFADKLNTVDVRATKDGVVRWEIADNGSEFPVITIMPESAGECAGVQYQGPRRKRARIPRESTHSVSLKGVAQCFVSVVFTVDLLCW